MSAAMVKADALAEMAGGAMTRDQVELIKRTIAKGATDDELQLFVATSGRLKLDPFARQIFAIKRWDPDTQDMGMTTHVSIDGLRLIAERTAEYLPADELPEFRYNPKGELVACVVHVLKWRRDAWHRVPAIAFFDEYAQKKKAGGYTKNWAEKPHIMLAKCAEALAIRKAFPNETSGAYVAEEFGEDDEPRVVTAPPVPPPVPPPKTTAPMPAASQPPAPKHTGPGPAVDAAAARRTAPTQAMRPARQAPPASDAGPDPRPVQEAAPYTGPGAEAFGQGEAAPQEEATTAPSPLDDLPPAPANPSVDAAGLVLVDQIMAALAMATNLAEYREQRKAMESVRNDERQWLAPHLVNALMRLLANGPEDDLDGVLAALGKFRSGNWISVERLAKAEAIYKDRRAAP